MQIEYSNPIERSRKRGVAARMHEAAAKSRTLVVVAGMHRSGTSAVAGELANAGIATSDNLLPAAPENPKGFFEDRHVVALNATLLQELGSEWSDPSPLPIDWMEHPSSRRIKRELTQYLAVLLNGREHFVLKDPRFCRTYPLLASVARELGWTCRVVAPVRHPLDVTRSLWDRNHLPQPHALQLWLRYYMDLIAATAGVPIVWLDFAEWSSDPRRGLAKISEAVGIHLNLSAEPFLDAKLLTQRAPEPAPEPVIALMSDAFTQFRAVGYLDAVALRQLYNALGGDYAAYERRHYSIVQSILGTVTAELKDERAEKSALRKEFSALQDAQRTAHDDPESTPPNDESPSPGAPSAYYQS